MNMMEIPPFPPPTRLEATAALLIIGDELLKGSVTDKNGPVAAKVLLEAGFELRKIVIVPDNEEDIEAELLRLSRKYTIVITSGGLGPTLDDLTIKAVSSAFKRQRKFSSIMLQFLNQFVEENSTSAESIASCDENAAGIKISYTINSYHKSAALLPEDCILNFHPSESKSWPVLQIENVFILPGVPAQFQKHITILKEYFLQNLLCSLKCCFQEGRKIYLEVEEDAISEEINIIMRKYSDAKIGSYPSSTHRDYKTLIDIKGENAVTVDLVVRDLISVLPVGCVLKIEALDYRKSQVSIVTSIYLQT
eukprot:gene16301-18473_t